MEMSANIVLRPLFLSEIGGTHPVPAPPYFPQRLRNLSIEMVIGGPSRRYPPFSGTGITDYLENVFSRPSAQSMANHASDCPP